MAYVEPSRRAPQHNAPAPAAQMPRTQSDRKHLGVHARQLAIQSHLQILRRYRRSLLRFLEQAHRSAMAHHVHRLAQLGSWVLVSEGWYDLLTSVDYPIWPHLHPGFAADRELDASSLEDVLQQGA